MESDMYIITVCKNVGDVQFRFIVDMTARNAISRISKHQPAVVVDTKGMALKDSWHWFIFHVDTNQKLIEEPCCVAFP